MQNYENESSKLSTFLKYVFFLYYCSVNISVQHYKEIKLVPS